MSHPRVPSSLSSLFRFFPVFVLVTLAVTSTLRAQGWTPDLTSQPSIHQRGYQFGLVLKVDYARVLGGNAKGKDGLLGNVDLTLDIDTGEAGWWGRGRVHLYLLGTYHTSNLPSENLGDLQGTNNIEAQQAAKLYEAWIEQPVGENASLLFGLYDHNSEFDSLELAGLFINSSFGISPEISQVAPSIFPTSALALRLAVTPSESSYFLGAVYDGVPGDPDCDRGTHVAWSSSDGFFYSAEGGVVAPDDSDSPYYKLGFGAWYHDAEYEDFDGNLQSESGGVYMLAERDFFERNDGATLSAFFQAGHAMNDYHPIRSYLGAGVNLVGLIPSRRDDVIGLAVAFADLGDDYRRAVPGLAPAETVIELTYATQLFSWLAIQPDLQYVIDPAGEANLDNALALVLRVELAF